MSPDFELNLKITVLFSLFLNHIPELIAQSLCYNCSCKDCGDLKCHDVKEAKKIPGNWCQLLSYDLYEERRWKNVVSRGVYNETELNICRGHFLEKNKYRNIICRYCLGYFCNDLRLEKRTSCYDCECEGCQNFTNCMDVKNVENISEPSSGICFLTSWLEKRKNQWTPVVKRFSSKVDSKEILENCEEKKRDTDRFWNVICETCIDELCNNRTVILPLCYACNCTNCSIEENNNCLYPSEGTANVVLSGGQQCVLFSWDEYDNKTWRKFIRRFPTSDGLDECKQKIGQSVYRNVVCEVCNDNCSELLLRSCYECECEDCAKDNDCLSPKQNVMNMRGDEKCVEQFWTGKAGEEWKRFFKRFITAWDVEKECNTRNVNSSVKNVACQTLRIPRQTSPRFCYVCECEKCNSTSDADCITPGNTTKVVLITSKEKCILNTWLDKDGKKNIKRFVAYNNDWKRKCEQMKKKNDTYKNLVCEVCEMGNCIEANDNAYCYFCENCPTLDDGAPIVEMENACYTEIVELKDEETGRWRLKVKRNTGDENFMKDCSLKQVNSNYRNVQCFECFEDRCNNRRGIETTLCYDCFNCFDVLQQTDIVATPGMCLIEIGRRRSYDGWEKYVIRNTSDNIMIKQKSTNLFSCKSRAMDLMNYQHVDCFECSGDLCNGGPVGLRTTPGVFGIFDEAERAVILTNEKIRTGGIPKMKIVNISPIFLANIGNNFVMLGLMSALL